MIVCPILLPVNVASELLNLSGTCRMGIKSSKSGLMKCLKKVWYGQCDPCITLIHDGLVFIFLQNTFI